MKRKRLFFDIETSFNIGFFWKSSYNVTIPSDNIIKERAVICVCWKWEGEDEIHSLHWDENQSDKDLLKKFVKVLAKADEIIAHNGDRFDIKWLRTRCLLHDIPMFPKYETIDTLKVAKSQFSFNSNRLDYIAKFTGEGSKMEHEGISLWKKVILEEDQEALENMIAYCKRDVEILEKVFRRMRKYAPNKSHYGALKNKHGEKYSCPECGNTHIHMNKTYTTAMGTTKHHVKCANKSCGTRFTVSNKSYMTYLKDKIRSKNIK